MRGENVSSVNFSSAAWRKSSRSGDGSNGACVEVAFVSATVGVRDSKSQEGACLVFGDASWRAFAEGLKAGC
ncbi:DUF397 domain-containing protein [Actinophytocola sp.]|uniref:DUF397 domain-containing protein n=1 Tax=Actinophytocola sp. TaxID=1872138 RepID=UPI002ED307DC